MEVFNMAENVKKTTKKASNKKGNTDKKVEVVKVETKDEEKKNNKFLTGVKAFFNNPAPLIIVLIAIIAVLLIFISRINVKNKIYVGEINKADLQVANVHYFTNGDMNYFYASTAAYLGEKTQVYSYQMGYYAVTDDNNYIEFATRSKKSDTKADLADVIEELSGWNFGETNASDYFFSKDVIDNIDNLHFVVKASTKKGSDDADIVIDYPVELSKITK